MARRHRHPAGRRLALRLTGAFVCCCATLGGACTGMGGRSDPPGPSRTVLPREVGVPAAIAAGEQALMSRGYTIERDEATADKGAVVGVGRALRWLGPEPRVRVEARLAPGGVEVTVTRVPPRSADADLELLGEVRARLGLR